MAINIPVRVFLYKCMFVSLGNKNAHTEVFHPYIAQSCVLFNCTVTGLKVQPALTVLMRVWGTDACSKRPSRFLIVYLNCDVESVWMRLDVAGQHEDNLMCNQFPRMNHLLNKCH